MKQALILIIALLVGCASPQVERVEPLPLSQEKPRTEVRSLPQREKSTTVRPKQTILDVSLIEQKPELKYGCEVTSLAMLLRYAGYDADKLTLARQVKKDTKPLVQENGDIKEWGDPKKGFVGDMTGRRKGFAVYNKPLEELQRRYMGERTVNLTGRTYEALLDSIAAGKPVVVWATGDFTPPTEWESWQKDGKNIIAPFDEHVVLMVGYDARHAYVNNPLNGVKQQRVKHEDLRKSWEALGKQALTYQ